jgi:hypothetical protein
VADRQRVVSGIYGIAWFNNLVVNRQDIFNNVNGWRFIFYGFNLFQEEDALRQQKVA